jgi:hypothetical protein
MRVTNKRLLKKKNCQPDASEEAFRMIMELAKQMHENEETTI